MEVDIIMLGNVAEVSAGPDGLHYIIMLCSNYFFHFKRNNVFLSTTIILFSVGVKKYSLSLRLWGKVRSNMEFTLLGLQLINTSYPLFTISARSSGWAKLLHSLGLGLRAPAQ